MILRLAFVALFMLCGCGRRETPVDVGNRDQILHFGNSSEPKDLDPHVVTGVPEHNILVALLEGLVSEDPRDLSPVPGVAESWTVSDDGRTYTFTLRASAQWSNGDPVVSDDFAFSFERILSPALGAEYAYMLFPLLNARAYNAGEIQDFSRVGVRNPDPRTLILELESPTPYFLSLLNHFSWFPAHPPTIKAFKAETDVTTGWTRPPHFVGNGPFVLTTWTSHDRIIVEKSPTYWDRDSVTLNAIHFHAIGDHNAEERAFRSGQLHLTGTVPLERIAHYLENEPERLRLDPYLGCYYYLFNVAEPPLDDARVRRALSMSVDREKLVSYVTRGGESPAFHFTPPDTGGYTAEAGIEFNPEQARALLAEAGFPDGKGFPPVPLLYNTSDAHALIAQAIGQMWKETLGIEIVLNNMEWKVYLDATHSQEYSIARAGWIGDYADPNTFLDLWVTGGGNNRTGWSNDQYDVLIRKASRTLDRDARFAVFREAEHLLMAESPILPIYFYRSKTLIQPSVKGWHPTILDHHPYKHVHLEAPSKE